VGYDFYEKGCGIAMTSKENRTYVRGDIVFKVKFTLLSREEYENLERAKGFHLSLNESPQDMVFSEADDPNTRSPDGNLINFLIQMDEKLDQILSLLSKGDLKKGSYEEGTAINISGSGMNMIVDKPVDPGMIIHAKFFLTKLPFLYMEVFGEIVRVIPPEEKGEKKYQLGIEFLNLNESERDRIITAVFQHQRQTIRNKKSMSPI
jgi:PilZ domain